MPCQFGVGIDQHVYRVCVKLQADIAKAAMRHDHALGRTLDPVFACRQPHQGLDHFIHHRTAGAIHMVKGSALFRISGKQLIEEDRRDTPVRLGNGPQGSLKDNCCGGVFREKVIFQRH